MNIPIDDSEKIKRIKVQVNELLDKNEYNNVLVILNKELKEFETSLNKNYYILAEIAGSFITLGNESVNESSATLGLRLFEDNKDNFKGHITDESYNYCVANAYSALYKISTIGTAYWPPKPKNVENHLFSAKVYYLKAFKSLDLSNLDSFGIQVLTNLGSNLNHSGRIVEALQLFDIVLNNSPEFPQAIASKADGLLLMIRTTKCELTISIFAEIYRLNKLALENHIPIDEVRKGVEFGFQKSKEFLEDNNFDISSIPKEIHRNDIEYKQHKHKIKFFLDNFLSLSEHSLYCKCAKSRIDTLMIGYKGFETSNIKISKLEFLLNEIKSEFSLARTLFYEYSFKRNSDNIKYESLGENFVNGIGIEKLRASFRFCFGIFDKIAWGICYLFDLEIKDNIYFENFWQNPRGPKDRWDKINSFNNLHLTALYSIATDMQKEFGEFDFYKKWRNMLEHGAFFIKKNGDFIEDSFSSSISEDEFRDSTKHLLQLTRAAIFSYVFCVRIELVED